MSRATQLQATLWQEMAQPDKADLLSTGYAELDALLPGGGWVRGELVEILLSPDSLGAMRLVMPALVQLSSEKRWLSWVSPPSLPSVSALATAGVRLSCIQLVRPKHYQDSLEIVEKSLISGQCSAVLAWPMFDDAAILSGLQRSAACSDALAFMFRRAEETQPASPAGLRLRLESRSHGNLAVSVLDQSGAVTAGPVSLVGKPVLPAGTVRRGLTPRGHNSRLHSARPQRMSCLYCR